MGISETCIAFHGVPGNESDLDYVIVGIRLRVGLELQLRLFIHLWYLNPCFDALITLFVVRKPHK